MIGKSLHHGIRICSISLKIMQLFQFSTVDLLEKNAGFPSHYFHRWAHHGSPQTGFIRVRIEIGIDAAAERTPTDEISAPLWTSLLTRQSLQISSSRNNLLLHTFAEKNALLCIDLGRELRLEKKSNSLNHTGHNRTFKSSKGKIQGWENWASCAEEERKLAEPLKVKVRIKERAPSLERNQLAGKINDVSLMAALFLAFTCLQCFVNSGKSSTG